MIESGDRPYRQYRGGAWDVPAHPAHNGGISGALGTWNPAIANW